MSWENKPPAHFETGNIVRNPGFEEPLSPAWGAYGVTTILEQSSAQKHGIGSYSVHVKINAGLGYYGFAQWFMGMKFGHTYKVSFWYYVVSGTPACNDQLSYGVSMPNSPLNTWLYAENPAAVCAYDPGFLAWLTGDLGTDCEFYVDDISITEVASPDGKYNLFADPGFERWTSPTIPEKWSTYTIGSNYVSAASGVDVPHSGTYCIELGLVDNVYSFILQEPKLYPNREFELSFYYKYNFSDPTPIRIGDLRTYEYPPASYSFLKMDGTWEIGGLAFLMAVPTTEWTKFSIRFTSLSGVYNYQCYPFIDTSVAPQGSILWLDDFKLEEVYPGFDYGAFDMWAGVGVDSVDISDSKAIEVSIVKSDIVGISDSKGLAIIKALVDILGISDVKAVSILQALTDTVIIGESPSSGDLQHISGGWLGHRYFNLLNKIGYIDTILAGNIWSKTASATALWVKKTENQSAWTKTTITSGGWTKII